MLPHAKPSHLSSRIPSLFNVLLGQPLLPCRLFEDPTSQEHRGAGAGQQAVKLPFTPTVPVAPAQDAVHHLVIHPSSVHQAPSWF